MTRLSTSNLPRRYPGLKPFERAQSAVFYGRGEDVVRLTNLLVRERFVVLFAKSGIGKTSLLQAGVAPELEKQGFAPVFLRLDKTEGQLAETVAETLAAHPLVGGRDNRDEQAGLQPTLWEQLKRFEFDLDGLPATPVLVFDQFEEVFTLDHSEASRRRFLGELADLANETMPEGIRTRLLEQLKSPRSAASETGGEALQWWEAQPNLRIVLSIRSDFLHLLDDISPLIPGILRNRYQLQPLDRRQAQTAIEAPARAEGEFVSPKFQYAPEALAEIVQFLAARQDNADPQGADDTLPMLRRREEIESFNLQILCQHIEETLLQQRQAEGFMVTPGFYGGKEGLDREISDFYAKQLQTLPAAYARRTGKSVDDPVDFMRTAACLIEESLVTPIGRRCSMVDDFLTNTWHVSQDFLDTLVESRLLRKELRLDDFYYEISHDTLLPAIVESRDRRRRQEAADKDKVELEARLAEEAARREAVEAQLRDLNERRNLNRKVALFSLLSLVLMLGLLLWGGWNWTVSVRKELEQAERNVRFEVYDAALPAYRDLADNGYKCWLLQKMMGKDVDQQLAETEQLERLHHAVMAENAATGDQAFFLDDYANALKYYRLAEDALAAYFNRNYIVQQQGEAATWRVAPEKFEEKSQLLSLRRESALKALIKQFDIRQRDYETFFEAGAWGQARRNLDAMQRLLPTHAADLTALQKALGLNETPGDYVQTEWAKLRRAGGG